MTSNKLEFLPFSPELAPYFASINREWIESMFALETADEQVLTHPEERIAQPGGQIWFARHPDLGIVGTCALMKKEEGVFELTKMGVLARARGLKVGEKLLQHVLAESAHMDIHCLFLLTNRKCEAAIHLYEKNGFEHSEDIMRRFGKSYQRCDVAMLFKG